MDFNDFVAEIQRLAIAAGATDVDKPYCEPETWRDVFNDGLSPYEAWAEEMSAAVSMGG